MKKILPLFLLLTGIYCNANAQIPEEPVNIQSPNATSLGLYGEVPVSYFTGVPNIEVPLYTLQDGEGTSLPISLGYHASGFRPDVHPGWVGMGWSLNAGGIITREVHDEPDDYNNPNKNYGKDKGFYFNYGVLNVTNWNHPSYMQSIADDISKYWKDTEPDEFSFNFLGYSGKFYMGADGQWKVKCDKPVKVKLSQEAPFLDVPFTAPHGSLAENYSYTKTFGGFTITVEDGTEYVFGGTTSAIEYSIGFFSQYTDDWIAGAWYLKKIIKDGHEINFDYERDSYINQMSLSHHYFNGASTLGSGEQPCKDWSASNFISSGKLVSPVYLASIHTPNSTVYFDRSTSTELRYDPLQAYGAQYSAWSQRNVGSNFLPFLQESTNEGYLLYPKCLERLQWKKLDKIRVVLRGQQVKSFGLAYNNEKSDRLILFSVTEQGLNSAEKPPYAFLYYDAYMPPYLASQSDHWGFYNAKYADGGNYSTYYSNREPNSNLSIALTGTLKQITYPTGGRTLFEFEQHAYSKELTLDRSKAPSVLPLNKHAGGLRIRKISSYSSNAADKKLEKEFFYVDGYRNDVGVYSLASSGVLGGQVKYYFTDYRIKDFEDNNVTYSLNVFSSQSTLPVSSNSQGSHIGYSQVVEKRSDRSYSKYHFSNFDSGYHDEAADATLQVSRTPYDPYTSVEEERGKLRKEEVYNDADVRVRLREIEYIALNKSTEYVKSLKVGQLEICSEAAALEGTAYKFYTYSFLPVKETVTVFGIDGLAPVTTVKDISYNSFRLVKEESFTSSEGQLLKTSYKYPFDFLYNGPLPYDPITQGVALMPSRNMLNYPVETVQFKDGKLVNATVQTYMLAGNNIKAFQTFKLESLRPLEASEYNSPSYGNPNAYNGNYAPFIIDDKLKISISFDEYDNTGNLLQLHKIASEPVTYLWSYSKTLPVAEVKNASYTDVEAALGGSAAVESLANSAALSPAQLEQLKGLQNKLPDARVTIYTYDPLVGMTSATDPNGRTVYYGYDSFGRLQAARDNEGNVLKTYEYNYEK